MPLNFTGDGSGVVSCVVVHALSVRCKGDGRGMLRGLYCGRENAPIQMVP